MDTIKSILGWSFSIGLICLIGYGLFFSNENTSNGTIKRTDDYETERSYGEYGDYDCSDFSSQWDAQAFFESEGGPDEDYHNLDRDGDGQACETLP